MSFYGRCSAGYWRRRGTERDARAGLYWHSVTIRSKCGHRAENGRGDKRVKGEGGKCPARSLSPQHISSISQACSKPVLQLPLFP